MFEKFKDNFPPLKDKWDEYVGLYTRIEVPAKKILLKEGEVSKRFYFIEKGCLRLWFNNRGKDITFQFFFENEGASSAESFRKSVPSIFTIETVEPCILHWITKEDLVKIMAETTQLPEMRDNMMEAMFERQLRYMNQLLSFIRDTPSERYLHLIEENPQIVQRVPQQYIASYFGITPVSLSRIRSRLKK